MTLAVHAITGVAVARLFPNHPLTAFFAAFASHFLLDSIVHWHYPLYSIKRHPSKQAKRYIIVNRKKIHLDVGIISSDFILGIALSYILFGQNGFELIFLLGIVGGTLPDLLTFLYWVSKNAILAPLHRFHNWIHAKKRLDDKHALGISLQILTALFVVILSFSVLS